MQKVPRPMQQVGADDRVVPEITGIVGMVYRRPLSCERLGHVSQSYGRLRARDGRSR